jgi:hypothetical protein
MKNSLPVRIVVSIVFVFVVVASAFGGAPGPQSRSWVSGGIGDDANPCTRTAPCATFAGALAVTAAGGEIDVLDPGDFGPVTITKSISIVGNGVTAGIVASGVDAITISAGFNDVVTLKGLTLEGTGLGLSGIKFNVGAALQVENCTINNFTVNGIDFNPSGVSALLTVKNSTIRNNAGTGAGGMGGVYLHPVTVGARATFIGVHFDHNKIGLRADDNSFASMKDSDVLANSMTGVLAMSTSLGVTIDIENCLVAQNLGDGITSKGGSSTITLSNVAVNKNGGFGLRLSNSGTIISFANNRVAGNSVDGSPSYTITQK